jgi:hypothetical protein
MATITTDKSGRRRLQFTDPNGRRQTVRLGKIPKRTAESFKIQVEHLLTAQITRQPIDAETARWVAALDDVIERDQGRSGKIRGFGAIFLM